MDERELAHHVFEILDQAAHRNAVHHVMSVHLALGGRRKVDPDRLRERFDDVARGTVAEGARLKIDVLPVRRRCHNCGAEFDGSDAAVPCPACAHPVTEALDGEQMRVLDIEVD
jgi:hydrogenase nickel incorporation protein HypA/HybF